MSVSLLFKYGLIRAQQTIVRDHKPMEAFFSIAKETIGDYKRSNVINFIFVSDTNNVGFEKEKELLSALKIKELGFYYFYYDRNRINKNKELVNNINIIEGSFCKGEQVYKFKDRSAGDIFFKARFFSSKVAVYLDTCSFEYRKYSNVIRCFIKSDNSKNELKDVSSVREIDSCFVEINDFSDLARTLYFQNYSDTLLNSKLAYIEDKFDNELTAVKKTIRSGYLSFIISLAPQIGTLNISSKINNIYNAKYSAITSRAAGIGLKFTYQLKNDLYGSLGFQYNSFILNKLMALEKEYSLIRVGSALLDQDNQTYDRYIQVNELQEKINWKSDRFQIGATLSRVLNEKWNLSLGCLFGLDFNNRVNYNLESSSVAYYGEYSQYGIYGTTSSGIGDFGKTVSLNSHKYSFLNNNLNYYAGLRFGPEYKITDKLYLKGAFELQNSFYSFSNPRYSADLPVYSWSQYNSSLFRAGTLKFSTLFFNLSLGYKI